MSWLKKILGGAPDPAARGVGDIRQALELYRAGRFEEALRIADALIAEGPGIPLSWRFRGECLYSLGRYAEAVPSFDKATAIGGKGTQDTFLWAAIALHQGGQKAEARERLERALRGTLTPELRARVQDTLQKFGAA